MPSTPRAPLDLDAVARWAEELLGPVRAVSLAARTRLNGGEVSDAVERVDLDVRPASGEARTLALVYKRTVAAELQALRALREVPGIAGAVPVLIDGGIDADGAWIAIPFHAGEPPAGHEQVPASVLESLAPVHARFTHGTDRLTGIERIDPAFWRRMCLETALGGVASAARRRAHPVLHRAASLLPGWAEDPRIARALATLPPTLVHGDVHAGNVLRSPAGAVLIDWGSARIGPAMLDVANCAAPGSANHRAYLAAWERAGGSPLDPELADRGFRWATVQVNVQYLGWAAEHLDPPRIAGMLDRAETAMNALGCH